MTTKKESVRGQVSLTPAAAALLLVCKQEMSDAVGTGVSFSQVIEYLINYEAGRVRKLIRVSSEPTDACE
jgi:hypothetical protein